MPVDFRFETLYVLTVLSLLVAGAEWLARRGPFRHFGTALLVILMTAVVANLGVLPAGSTTEAPVPAYDAIFSFVAPVALFWLLLPVNLREVLKAGLPLIALFLAGAAGTAAGVLMGMALFGGADGFGPLYRGVAGMFTGTYIGGSVNFNALALHYDVVRDGVLYGGSVVVDNIMTTVWMVGTLAAPQLLAVVWSRRMGSRAVGAAPAMIIDLPAETESLNPRALAIALGLGGSALWVSMQFVALLAGAGLNVPVTLVITTLALVLAQIPAVSRLPGTRVLGMYTVYVFLAVVGAFCDVRALSGIGTLGLVLLAFVTVIIVVHAVVVFGTAWACRLDLDSACVASQANIGGSTSALALAKSLGREDLLLPAILLGALGNAIGTFAGFLVAGLV